MAKAFRFAGLIGLIFITVSSFGQSLNFSAGYSSAIIKTDEPRERSYTEAYPYGDLGTLNSLYRLQYTDGFSATIAYEFRLGNRFSLETGLKYQHRGYQRTANLDFSNDTESWTQDSDFTVRFNYIDLPIVLNTAITTGDVRIYAKTGVYAGFMLAGRYHGYQNYRHSNGDGGESAFDFRFEQDAYDNDERLTAGFLLGAGVAYKGFFFESNFTQGAFTPVEPDSEFYTQEFSFALGYKIKFNQ